MVRLAQMECFHPAGEMDDALLLSVWSANLINEAELQAEAANVKLLSNRRFILANPQKHHHPPEKTDWFGLCMGNLVGVKMVQSCDHPLQQLTHAFRNYICLFTNVKPSVASTLAPPLFRTGFRKPRKWHKPLRQQHLRNMLVNWPTINLTPLFFIFTQLFLLLYILLLWW